MRILLLNDNPVVRKLVALSAQKTKDDLNVIWSVDEIEHDVYDLLIVDDAYYSDEIMAALNERITYKTSLLMATRGNAVPAGFDKVINKPFLPTDLVELFASIEKTLSVAVKKEDEKSIDLPSIDLNLMVDDFDESEDERFELETEVDLSEENEVDLANFEILDEFNDEPLQGMKTNVLDHEEVQELQDLLEDTDTFDEDEEFIIEELALDDEEMGESAEDLTLEDELLGDALLDDLMMDEMDALKAEEAQESLEDLPRIEEDDTQELASDLLSDDEFDDLEQQIQDAVDDLDLDDLDSVLDDAQMDDFGLDDLASFDGLDELDTIDEREIKRAIGESVEEEVNIRVGAGEHSSLDAEALSEAMGKPSSVDKEDNGVPGTPVTGTEKKSSPSEGMEALQALLKALSNDEVAASLKGLNISININFGNEK